LTEFEIAQDFLSNQNILERFKKMSFLSHPKLPYPVTTWSYFFKQIYFEKDYLSQGKRRRWRRRRRSQVKKFLIEKLILLVYIEFFGKFNTSVSLSLTFVETGSRTIDKLINRCIDFKHGRDVN